MKKLLLTALFGLLYGASAAGEVKFDTIDQITPSTVPQLQTWHLRALLQPLDGDAKKAAAITIAATINTNNINNMDKWIPLRLCEVNPELADYFVDLLLDRTVPRTRTKTRIITALIKADENLLERFINKKTLVALGREVIEIIDALKNNQDAVFHVASLIDAELFPHVDQHVITYLAVKGGRPVQSHLKKLGELYVELLKKKLPLVITKKPMFFDPQKSFELPAGINGISPQPAASKFNFSFDTFKNVYQNGKDFLKKNATKVFAFLKKKCL